MNCSPIIVFAYNRPSLLKQTLAALACNKYADQSVLYIFCDGPKENALSKDLDNIARTREIAHAQSWAKDTIVIEAEHNKGLGTSIIEGVTLVIEKYGRAIIVEDDLITSPAFLAYMNACLEHYANRPSVFSVSALSRPQPERFFPKDYPYDVYCSPTHRPWGWATWKDRWSQVDWTASVYEVLKNNESMKAAFCRLGADYYEALCRQQENAHNVWSIRFALAHFVNHAVSISPIVSYVQNIGFGADSTNCTGDNHLWTYDFLNTSDDIKFCDVLYEDARIINAWYSFSISEKRSLIGKLKNWYGRKFLHRDEYALKGRVYVD